MFSIRTVIQDYGRCCEHLLSSVQEQAPLSQEETQFIQYYVAQMQKKFDGRQLRPGSRGDGA
jgi:hypothetical protein